MINLSAEARYLRQHGLARYLADTASDARSAVLYWLWEEGVPAVLLTDLWDVSAACYSVAYTYKTPFVKLLVEAPILALDELNTLCTRWNFD